MLRTTTAAVLASTVLLALVPAVPSAAAESDPTGRMMLVLDSSGSMKEKAAGGQTKIAAAKQALGDVISSLPDDQVVGLRVYGAEVFSRDDAGACKDSQRVVDLAADNRDELRKAVSTYKPYGETPIGYALQQAGKDLGGEGQRTIVLVSDGEPTCDPDPCKVAKDLSEDGIDLKIDVVGLDVSGKARNQLRCIADAGNGTYYDADDAESLTDSLTVSSTRASRPFDLTGEPVEGTADPASAPTLGNGQYLDRIPASGSVSYRIPRTAPGSTIHVGVTLKGVGGSAGNGVKMQLFPGGTDASPASCGTASGFGNGIGVRDPILYGSGMTWQPDPKDPCNTAKEIVATLDASVGGAEIAGRPIEIAVYEEPPLADRTGRDQAAAPAEPEWTTLEPSTPQDVVPGTSIANAPVVADGTYAGDLNPGESQVFAVPLDWGQNVQAQLDARLTRDVIEAGGVGSGIDVSIIGPVRDGGAVSFYGNTPADWEDAPLANLQGTPTFRTGAQSQTIGFLNRGSTSPDVQGASVAGLRYVQVTYNVRGDEANLPYTLTLRTNGAAGEGEPKYADTDGLLVPKADSRLVERPSDDQGDGDAPADEAGKDEAGAKDDDGGLPLLPVGLGLLGALLVGGAVVVLRRSRVAD
ncbi:VWA domain-containing protein [Aeromicrobium sp. NPDC092404]|uniref:vWA domain-containing protein n=1 Tax=Aeromicrobium sp. NPDC092404 TaxID=3154976 RepID=UPI0034270951